MSVLQAAKYFLLLKSFAQTFRANVRCTHKSRDHPLESEHTSRGIGDQGVGSHSGRFCGDIDPNPTTDGPHATVPIGQTNLGGNIASQNHRQFPRLAHFGHAITGPHQTIKTFILGIYSLRSKQVL
jgi:hypothetical protein